MQQKYEIWLFDRDEKIRERKYLDCGLMFFNYPSYGKTRGGKMKNPWDSDIKLLNYP